MSVTYSTAVPDKDQYFALFASTGWYRSLLLSADQLHEAVSRSWCLLAAYDGDRLVGCGRAIGDGVLHALIVDLIVLPEYQRRDVGSHIVGELVRECRSRGIPSIQLFCGKGKAGFYQQNGFAARAVDAPGMEWKGRET
jgi:GNAT superfamily N-acetyltransferase